jgi:DNA-binding NtrC family response regulator
MATSFALRAAARLGLPPRLPMPGDIERLMAYRWPGNVRELATVIERAAILGNGRALDIPTALGTNALATTPTPLNLGTAAQGLTAVSTESRSDDDHTLDETVRRRIEATLAACVGRIEGPFGAARRLGVNPHTLRARMRRLGIDWKRFRQPQP